MRDGIPCPACGHGESAVKDSRPGDKMIRRRRHCAACGLRFTTYEAIVAEHQIVHLRRAAGDLAAAVEEAEIALQRIRQSLTGFATRIGTEAYLANGVRLDVESDND